MIIHQQLIPQPARALYFDIDFDRVERDWNYVTIANGGDQWVAAFREYDQIPFKAAWLSEKGVACLLSGGYAFLLDMKGRKLVKELDLHPYHDILPDTLHQCFYLAGLGQVLRLDASGNFQHIQLPDEFERVNFTLLTPCSIKLLCGLKEDDTVVDRYYWINLSLFYREQDQLSQF